MKLKLLSWNIWISGQFDKIADFLRQSKADVIALQEVKGDDPERDVIGYLEKLGYQNVFVPVRHAWGKEQYSDGPAVFSKYKIAKKAVHLLSEIDQRAAAQADIQVEGKILHVFSVHLLHTHQKPSDTQNLQAYNLLRLLPESSTIVAGDFNATPNGPLIKKMRQTLVDTDPSSSPTWSVYPAGCRVCGPRSVDTKLDYIFASKDLRTSGFEVGSSTGSDHLPISVIVEV